MTQEQSPEPEQLDPESGAFTAASLLQAVLRPQLPARPESPSELPPAIDDPVDTPPTEQ